MNELIRRSACVGAIFLLAAAGLWAAATNRYVATNVPGSAYPFDSWEKAGTNLIEVVNVANANNAGDIVFVSNGIYYLTNQISISGNVMVTNFTADRAMVIINGNYNNTTNRCFYMNHANAIVCGFTITNGCAQTNDALLAGGGGVYLNNGVIRDCLVTGNRCFVNAGYVLGGGGGIAMLYATADYCSVVGNVAEGISGSDLYNGGGGLSTYEGSSLVTNCYVAYNTATNRVFAGGIRLCGGRIYNCTIIGNETKGAGSLYGGGLWGHSAYNTTEIKSCTIISNKSVGYGGGVLFIGGAKVQQIQNCLFAYNEASLDGGAILLYQGNTVIDSCTIVSNRAVNSGGGIFFGHVGSPYITNVYDCIIYDNYAAIAARKNVYDNRGGVSQTAVVYSCVEPGSGFDIAGVVTNPPSFAGAINGNYRLSPDSPCLNKGTNRPWMPNAVDRDGNPRIRYGTVDMGAYEHIYPGTIYKFP